MDNVPFADWEYRRPAQDQDKIHILLIIDHKNKRFNIRAEHDPKGKDSLGAWYADSLKVMKKYVKKSDYYYDWHHVNINRYLVEHIDTVDQTVLSSHYNDNSTQKSRQAGREAFRPMMRALRVLWKDKGYSDMNKYNPGKTAGTVSATEEDTEQTYLYDLA